MFKVLIAEDEKIIRLGLKALIKELTSDFIVAGEATDGERALSLIQHSQPDLLITDIRMPKMNGLSLIEKVKELIPSLPIIIISAYDEFEYAKKGIQHGVDGYLLKPINRTEFIKCMESIRQQLNQNLEELYEIQTIDHPLIRKITLYILKNIDKEISLSKIAQIACLHPSYLSQWFKEEMDLNFSEFVTDLRIKKAKKLLQETELKVYEVAQLVGYQSDKHFMKLFKRKVNKTPSEYRDDHTKLTFL